MNQHTQCRRWRQEESTAPVRGLLLCWLCLGVIFVGPGWAGERWKRIVDDGIHDLENPAVGLLQEPAEALSQLPVDTANVGNKVRWIQALEQGYIEPRANIHPGTDIEKLDLDIIMKNTGSANYVLFPHDRHTEWLDCSNCHDHIFKSKAGTTAMSMLQILSGEFCGRCHGAVAFPLTACQRCHSVPLN